MKKLDESLEAIEKVMRERIADKRRQMARWHRRKEDAARREEMLLKELSELELALSVLRRVIGKPTPPDLFGALDTRRLRGQTVADSCFDIIRQRGGRARVTEIIDMLIAAGKLKDDRRIAYATVVKSMERDDRFAKVGRGEYGLAETQVAQEADSQRASSRPSGDLLLD